MTLLRLLTTEELKDVICKEYDQLKLVAEISGIYEELKVFFGKEIPQNWEGTFIFADNIGYHYVCMERGQEKGHKITDELFEICYWAFKHPVHIMASKFELKNRILNQDFRRLMFAKKIELLSAIGENYKKRGEIAIDEILKIAPYDDTL